jgi:hypothetical protein
VLRGWGGELLRRDNVDKRKRKKRFIRLQVHPYRDLLTGLITPVSLYLCGCTYWDVLAGVGSSDLSPHSGTSTWYIWTPETSISAIGSGVSLPDTAGS